MNRWIFSTETCTRANARSLAETVGLGGADLTTSIAGFAEEDEEAEASEDEAEPPLWLKDRLPLEVEAEAGAGAVPPPSDCPPRPTDAASCTPSTDDLAGVGGRQGVSNGLA